MRLEADLSNFIHNSLSAVEISSDMQSSRNVELDAALSTASKNLTGGHGYPDHIALVDDFVLVMEDKSDRLKLVLRDGGEILQTADAVKNYALNGALFYALKIIDGSRYKKVFAFGNAGDRKHHVIQPIFIGADKKITELPEVDTFKNFTADNIEAYYRRAVLKETPPEEVELKTILRNANTLHEYLRSYAQLGEEEKPLVVSAILLALAESRHGFNVEQLTGDKVKTDGAKIFELVEAHLKRANVRPEVKREQVLDQFRLIKNLPALNAVNRTLAKTPLKFFAQFIADNIFDAVVNNSAEDYLGRFYGEFVSYSSGNGQSLGVVLTPRHITELFCELVDLKPDDVVFDPCCGTGGFLIAAMNHMLKLADNDAQRKSIRQNQLYGIELRPNMFSTATTNMILRGDGKSNLTCGDFFAHDADKLQLNGATVGFMNPPYAQADKPETKHLSELRFTLHLLESVTVGGRVAVIVPVSAMIGKTRADKLVKADILKNHTLEGVISLNKNTFYRIGVVPCIAVFTAGEPHPASKLVKFVNFENDGFEVKKHVGLVETERAKDRKFYLLDCWRGKIDDVPSKFMVTATIDAGDEWLHSFYYYNDELPTEDDFANTVADYLTFEFNMIAHGRGYLFDAKKNFPPLTETPTLDGKVWREFCIGDLFRLETGKGKGANHLVPDERGISYLGATNRNNAVLNFVRPVENLIQRGNCIAFIRNGEGSVGYSVYKREDFIATSDITCGYADFLNEYVGWFITTVADQVRGKYNFNYKRSDTRLKREKILLPVTEDDKPDFAFMESYVRSLEEKILRRYLERVDKLSVSGGGITSFAEHDWKFFDLASVFTIRATSSGIDKIRLTLRDGEFPYVTRSDRNNGIQAFICEQAGYGTDAGNCITVGLDTQTAFYQPKKFYTGQNIQILTNDRLNVHVANFLLPLIKNTLSIFNWGGNGATLTRLRRSKILLPATDDGKPDFVFMEAFAKNKFAEILRHVLDRFSA